MKFRVISTALIFLMTSIALAQEPAGPPPGGPGPDIERLTTLLDLDAGQKVAVQKVLDEQHAQMKAFREQAKASQERPTREQMQAQHEQMRKETTEKMRAILSDTQMKKFEALGPMGGPGRMKRDKAADTDKEG